MSIGDGGYGERDHTGEDGPAHGRDASGRLTTRTRLPDGERVTRQPARPGRSLVTVLGVVVLLIAAIAFANRGGSGSPEGSGEEAADGKGGAAQPTAPTGKKPVDTEEGAIPSGFAQTEQGAQSAAANYAVALGGTEMFDADKRNEVLDAVIAPKAVERFRSRLDDTYSPAFLKKVGLDKDGSAPEGYAFVSRTTPVGTKTVNYSDSRATVQVWCSGLLGLAGEGSKKPVTDSWFTLTMKLAWNNGDWKATAQAQKAGPAPVSGDSTASGAEEIAGAVDGFGGFTYAR
ncbi:hypothetical protein [Streptomyces sulphureus]|uniref:hypothetical protein n=1 Tax=Streptomyces sulphureus TaxID=47758 RepID=UPI0003784C3C|nr:hypothetical protein [Streptomyces sulphureus]